MGLHVNCYLLQEEIPLMKAERYIIYRYRINSFKSTLNSCPFIRRIMAVFPLGLTVFLWQIFYPNNGVIGGFHLWKQTLNLVKIQKLKDIETETLRETQGGTNGARGTITEDGEELKEQEWFRTP